MARLIYLGGFALVACSTRTTPTPPSPEPQTGERTGETARETATETAAPAEPEASVTAVAVSGSPGAYTFAVTLASDETGCDQYADWWEVVAVSDDRLVYRRILGHSHTDEQPFTRSGSPVDVQPDEALFVRAHLSPVGYRGAALRGSVTDGFTVDDRAESRATALETADPQPTGCLY